MNTNTIRQALQAYASTRPWAIVRGGMTKAPPFNRVWTMRTEEGEVRLTAYVDDTEGDPGDWVDVLHEDVQQHRLRSLRERTEVEYQEAVADFARQIAGKSGHEALSFLKSLQA